MAVVVVAVRMDMQRMASTGVVSYYRRRPRRLRKGREGKMGEMDDSLPLIRKWKQLVFCMLLLLLLTIRRTDVKKKKKTATLYPVPDVTGRR